MGEEVVRVGLESVLVKVARVWVNPAEVESVLPEEEDTVVRFRSGEWVRLYKVAADDVVAVLASGARAAWPPRRVVGGVGPGTLQHLQHQMAEMERDLHRPRDE